MISEKHDDFTGFYSNIAWETIVDIFVSVVPPLLWGTLSFFWVPISPFGELLAFFMGVGEIATQRLHAVVPRSPHFSELQVMRVCLFPLVTSFKEVTVELLVERLSSVCVVIVVEKSYWQFCLMSFLKKKKKWSLIS